MDLRLSGTSPLTIRCASPSTIAVLPTPGSPISTGLFLVRRCKTWIVRRISSSRPITGSSLPCPASAVKSRVYFSSAWRASSSWAPVTRSPARISSIASRSRSASTSCSRSSLASGVLPWTAASKTISVAMNWSRRCWASLSAMFSSWFSPCETAMLPSGFCIRGRPSSTSRSAEYRASPSAPARPNRLLAALSDCCTNAAIKCVGSMVPWSWPTAIDWASASAIWNALVSLFGFMSKTCARCRAIQGRPAVLADTVHALAQDCAKRFSGRLGSAPGAVGDLALASDGSCQDGAFAISASSKA